MMEGKTPHVLSDLAIFHVFLRLLACCFLVSHGYTLFGIFFTQMELDLREAAGLIVDKFFGEEGYDSSDEEDAEEAGIAGGGKGVWSRQINQAREGPLAPLGRGAHLTRPAWMTP